MTGMTGMMDVRWWRSHGPVGWAPAGILRSTSPTLVPQPTHGLPAQATLGGRTAWHLPARQRGGRSLNFSCFVRSGVEAFILGGDAHDGQDR